MNPYHQGQLDFFCAPYAFINAMRLLFDIPLNQARGILAATLKEIAAHPFLWEAMLCNRTDHHWVLPWLLGRFCQPDVLPVRVARLPAAPLNDLAKAGEDDLGAWLDLAPPPPFSLDELGPGELYHPDVEFGQPLGAPEAPSERAWSVETLWPFLRRWLPTKKLFSSTARRKQKRCLLLRFHRFMPGLGAPFISHWSTGRLMAGEVLALFDCTASKDATHSLPAAKVALYPERLDGGRFLALEPQALYFLEKTR